MREVLWGSEIKFKFFPRNSVNGSDLKSKIILPANTHMGWDGHGMR